MKRLSLVFLFCLLPSLAHAVTANVQDKWIFQNGPASSASISTTSNVANNSILALGIWASDVGKAISSVDGSSCGGVTFTYAGDNPNTTVWGYYSTATVAGSCTVTVTFTTSVGGQIQLVLHEMSGVDTASPLDKHQGNVQVSPGTGTDAITSGANVTPTSDGQYIFGMTNSPNNASGPLSAGTGFTAGTSPGTSHADEFQVQGTATAVSATFTQPSAQNSWTTIIMTFKESGGGGGGPQPRNLMLLGVGP